MTQCPKCGAPRAADTVDCPRCGVVFAKFKQPVPVVTPAEPAPTVAMRPGDVAYSNAVRLARAAVLVGLVIWTWQFARAPMGSEAAQSVLHLPDLVFHEAGHVLFAIFGHFVSVLGGSLFQFALPLALAGVFLRQRDPFAAAVCTWWAGQNLLDVAPYIADARALQLVLLGGKTGAEVEGHDWEYLLTELGWLHLDRTLGLAAQRVGLIMMGGALVWGVLILVRHRAEPFALDEMT